jgi:hypothetical protein
MDSSLPDQAPVEGQKVVPLCFSIISKLNSVKYFTILVNYKISIREVSAQKLMLSDDLLAQGGGSQVWRESGCTLGQDK